MKNRYFFSASLVLAALLFVATNVSAQAPFQSAVLDTALQFLGMTPADFESDRIWVEDDSFLLPKVREAMKSPLIACDIARQFASATPLSIVDAGRIADMEAFANAPVPPELRREIDARLAAAVPPVADSFEPLLTAFALTENLRAKAFAGLTTEQRKAIIYGAPMWFEDPENPADDSLKGLLYRSCGVSVDTSQKITADSVLTLLYKVDRNMLSAASYAFARGLSMTAQAWKTTKSPFAAAVVPGTEGLILATRETPYGTFVLGGSGPNVYTGDFALIIDLGGDDRYQCRAGGAMGEIGHSISAVLDMNGNDFYGSGKACDQGAGVLGLGALVDLGGSDVYLGGAFSQGAGFCGVGLFFDNSGSNSLRAPIFAQAAAVCGTGLVVAGTGRNVFDLGEYGQAVASTFGVAALIGGMGNDVYRAGGLLSDAPLRPEDYASFAQGFAIGWRPRGGGGIALLHELGGNDFYNAEIYGQGVGYWYSLGALIDEGGNDVYNATQYAQGAGIHLAAGVLEDVAGDDRYGSRFGPGQGGAHDLAVATLYDHSGDDAYTMSGGQGMAITNSAALFFDGAGNDNYNTVEPGLGQGGVREARGFGNVAVFVDAEGHDVYSASGRADSTLWLDGTYAVGYDVAHDSVRPREATPPDTLIASDTLRSIADLFKDASKWEVTDNRALVRRARRALAAKGTPALHWVADNKMNTLEGLEQRAIADLFKTMPDSASVVLMAALNSTEPARRRNAVRTFSDMKYAPAAPALLEKLRDDSYAGMRPAILFTLGELGNKKALEAAQEYSRSNIERERLGATVCLGKLKEERGFAALRDRLGDASYAVRSAAIAALADQGPDVISILTKDLPQDADQATESMLLSAARLAGRWNAADSLKKFSPRLAPLVKNYTESTLPRIQGALCAAAVEIMEGKEAQKLLQKYSTVNNPLVQARIRQAQKKLK